MISQQHTDVGMKNILYQSAQLSGITYWMSFMLTWERDVSEECRPPPPPHGERAVLAGGVLHRLPHTRVRQLLWLHLRTDELQRADHCHRKNCVADCRRGLEISQVIGSV